MRDISIGKKGYQLADLDSRKPPDSWNKQEPLCKFIPFYQAETQNRELRILTNDPDCQYRHAVLVLPYPEPMLGLIKTCLQVPCRINRVDSGSLLQALDSFIEFDRHEVGIPSGWPRERGWVKSDARYFVNLLLKAVWGKLRFHDPPFVEKNHDDLTFVRPNSHWLNQATAERRRENEAPVARIFTDCKISDLRQQLKPLQERKQIGVWRFLMHPEYLNWDDKCHHQARITFAPHEWHLFAGLRYPFWQLSQNVDFGRGCFLWHKKSLTPPELRAEMKLKVLK